ncbi:MAG TPA: response regulator transcription factor [Terriglobales bacterium]|nr:response regulator transcription factor [Terriglobales bacterium]
MVDDFEGWRHFVSYTLKNTPRFQIVGEVSDGLEAVQKAQELQPDLIVLDIGLPKLNGIEAARLIRQVAPKSKILFLTENHSPDIAAESLSTGASGYVVKANAGMELLVAVEAVIRDKRFVSARLACDDLGDTTDAKKSVRPAMNAD